MTETDFLNLLCQYNIDTGLGIMRSSSPGKEYINVKYLFIQR